MANIELSYVELCEKLTDKLWGEVMAVGKISFIFARFRQALNVVPKFHHQEFKKELASTNLVRVEILSLMLIVMNLFLLIVDLTVFYPKWNINRGYVYVFHAHMILLVERSFFLLGTYILKKKKLNLLNRIKRGMVLYSAILGLGWCSFLSISVQALDSQVSAFIIGNFCIAAVIFLMPIESLLLFSVNFILFTYALFAESIEIEYFTASVVNLVFVFSFTLLLSYINISLFSKDYINERIIRKQAIELENSRNRLEETVKLRTQELVWANEQLIKEMGTRHEIEMQSIRTRLMYEENTALLNEIKEYEELRNVFFANLSHELRTPLNVIFSAQQMMQHTISRQLEGESKNSLIKYNGIVKQNCYRLIRLIGNLIDITKIDAKYFDIDKRNCDIVQVIENITLSVAEYIKDKNIELYFDTRLEEKIIACDPDKVERIILNLLSNAVKFTPEKGTINVSIRAAKGRVIIAVKDTGIGISKEMQNIIFERFVQADKSTTRNREGSGIGLSLVKSLVDLHQGALLLNSEIGRGSEFIIELPDEVIPFEEYIACTKDTREQNIERINIEFSDIYS